MNNARKRNLGAYLWCRGIRVSRIEQRLLWPHSLTAILCLLSTLGHAAAQEKASLNTVEKWTNVFGDQKVTLHFRSSGLETAPARAAWVLAHDGRSIARGEATPIAADGKPIEVAIPLTIPAVKAGAVLPLTLTVSLQDNDNGVLATAIKPLWVYPADPFADRREWLKKLNLRLYDPDGATAHRLDAAGVPYTLVGNADALAEGEPGIALIGEGLSFAVYLGLAGAMVKAAAGRPVLCLAPAGGAFAIPGTEGTEGETPARLRLPRAGIISDLDKRLDAEAWPRGMSAASRLTVKASRDQVVGEVQRGHDGWSWLECTYADSGTLVVCGFGIISQWDNSPTPRFLFARLLTYLDDRRSVNEERDRK